MDDAVVTQVKPLVRRWLRRPPISGRHSSSRDTVTAMLQLQATPSAELVLNPGSPADRQLVRFITSFNSERNCADTFDTVPVHCIVWPFPVLKYKYSLYGSNFVEPHSETVMV